jgi:hypothetical protein
MRDFSASGFLRRLARGVAGFLTLVVAIGALAAARAEGATLLDIIRSLAENTLGAGTVKIVRIDREATVSLQWDSATYRPGNTAAVTRELLFAEAALATGNIIATLPDIRGIRFTITRGKQILATGEVWRVDSIRLDFAIALGGGTYVPDPRVKPSSPGGDSGLQL